MPWVETESPSFTSRHEAEDADAAAALLSDLESFRDELGELFQAAPAGISAILHGRPAALAVAQPWLPLARLAASPASRRYMAGWFSRSEIHVLAPEALAERASGVEGSRDALMLTPLHEYAHVVVGANNPALPPPFAAGSFARYLRWAWLCEGAATHLAGQVPHLRPAVARRMREGNRPSFPPSARDAPLLGGTVLELLEEEAGIGAIVDLVERLPAEGAERGLERAFRRPLAEVEYDWRARLAGPAPHGRRRGHLYDVGGGQADGA